MLLRKSRLSEALMNEKRLIFFFFFFFFFFFYRNPTTVVIDINEGTVVEDTPATPIVEAAPKQPEPTEAKATPEPVKEEEQSTPKAEPAATPVKVSTPTARAARSTVGARTPKKSGKTAKLGIKKAPVNFNFEAAEAQAKQDMERKAKFGEDDEDVKGSVAETTLTPSTKPLSSRLAYMDSSNSSQNNEDEYEKLGFGMSRMNMDEKTSSTISMPSQKSYQAQQQQDETRSARDKFGSARAISSDQYFGRNEYDPAITAAESSRLSQFSSAKAISSDQYFGRESDLDSIGDRNRSYSSSNAADMGDWNDVQDQAVAMARKFVDQAALDLDAVKDLAENATSRVRSYFNA
jgi:ADP-ribosylation factor GTPase-activating protein 2/3